MGGLERDAFDFKRYVGQRLREIDDMDERKFAKTVILDGLGKLVETVEQKYQALETRVYQEIEAPDNRQVIGSTIVALEDYDPVNDYFYPVAEEDLDREKMEAHFADEGKQYLETVFLKADERTCKNFALECVREGLWARDSQYCPVRITIAPSVRYRNRVEQLYQIFQDNRMIWKTVNTAYFDKFYDVFVEGADGPITAEQVAVEWGEYDSRLLHNMLPLWNVQDVEFKSTNFMVPCVDGMYYEHEFPLGDKNSMDSYLIQSNEDILEIRYEETRIVIKSEKDIFENWKATRIIQGEMHWSLGYDSPLLTNRKKDSFFQRYAKSTNVSLMTKADLFRRIMELDISDYIEVTGYEIHENSRAYPDTEGMNWFVRDELFPMESRKVLLLKFQEKQPGHYLNDSMIRFVVSQMQLEIGEYRCVGVIEKDRCIDKLSGKIF